MKKKNFSPDKPFNNLPLLPPKNFKETEKIYKQLIASHKALAELKGYAELLPNKNIILNSITLKEAKDSSEIENIITTHEELYRSIAIKSKHIKPEVKEVINYKKALFKGVNLIKKDKLLTINMIIEIQKEIENNNAGIRKLPGTALINNNTGEILYTPPDDYQIILNLLKNLEEFINTHNDNFDTLTKLAIIHYQFEAIHPFYDGNGRTGRIINVLYLILNNILNEPFLYLSGQIIKNKSTYYKLLRNVTVHGEWEEWILFMLNIIELTAINTLKLINKIVNSMEEIKETIKQQNKKIYSRELIDLIFTNVYTKISHLVENGIASRNIAAKYLNELEKIGIMESKKIGKEKLFINKRLFNILKEEE